MTQQRTRRPTQRDVALLAGVSQSVVSYVLNDASAIPISPETRHRVLAAIETLGYVPNGAARSLRTHKTDTIASIIPDITNPFYAAFERGIQDVADGYDCDLITYNSDGLRTKEIKRWRSAQRARVDGLIIKPIDLAVDDFHSLLDRNVPVVVFGDPGDQIEPCPFDRIVVDDVAAARSVVAFLLSRGHSRIAVIAGPTDVARGKNRFLGYCQALAENGIAVDHALVRSGDYTEAAGFQATQELLALSPRPTAIFATNDLMAMGALIAVRQAGLAVPDDIALVGFDDLPAARLLTPPLTTVALFPERIGRRAAEMLFERVVEGAADDVRREVMPFELVIRSSA